jgi:hypothetical protein
LVTNVKIIHVRGLKWKKMWAMKTVSEAWQMVSLVVLFLLFLNYYLYLTVNRQGNRAIF